MSVPLSAQSLLSLGALWPIAQHGKLHGYHRQYGQIRLLGTESCIRVGEALTNDRKSSAALREGLAAMVRMAHDSSEMGGRAGRGRIGIGRRVSEMRAIG